jgi:SNF2 family DNA or RNA helicase
MFVLQVTVLLVSLKAAGVGLNLFAASHVIITDPWWNPFMEDQAIGRAHRIGQTCPVTVYRLVVKDDTIYLDNEKGGTIEERVLKLQVRSTLLFPTILFLKSWAILLHNGHASYSFCECNTFC